MSPQQRGGRVTAVCGLLLLLISGVAAAGAAVTGQFAAIPNTADGDPYQVPTDATHVWVAGDVFSLHDADQYRYVVVYTRDTADGIVHGCYPVDQEPAGQYVVSQYVHAQEVFGDAFIAAQGGRFIENIPLDDIVITDDTPVNGGKTYFGLSLGSIYGAANAPVPSTSPEPVPTAPHWPTLAPSQTTSRPMTMPTGVVSVTRSPGPMPTLPENASPIPMPTVAPTAALPIVTEPTALVPTSVPGYEASAALPVLQPTTEPAVTSAPSRVWGRRFAAWQAPSITGRRVAVGVASGSTVTTGGRATWTTTRTFGRFYPRWSVIGRTA